MGRVLLSRFHSLGDVVLATGIVEPMRRLGDQVEVATSPGLVPIFEGLPVARVWTVGKLSGAGRFDRVVDLQANATSRHLLRRLGPVRRNRGRSVLRRLLVLWGARGWSWPIPHAVERYAEAAGCDGVSRSELRPRIVATERDLEEARRLARSWEELGGLCVALAVGASRRMKRWPEARFDALAEALAERGLRSLRFLEPAGGAREGVGFVHAPLRPLKGLLSRCAVLVTNDSGVMHLGVGLGIPVVAIFGSTTRELGFGPLGAADRVVERSLACRPCAVHGARFCWQGHGRCLDEVSVAEVRDTVLDILQRRKEG